MKVWEPFAVVWLMGLVFVGFAVPPGSPKPSNEPQFGYTPEQLKVRIAELEARDTPYKPDTPQPGEEGFGRPIIINKAPAPAPAPANNGPILVTNVYSCVQWDWANPDGQLVYQYRPCGSRRNPWWTPE
jgi:hypothetical protein